jgi:hypothetical protein
MWRLSSVGRARKTLWTLFSAIFFRRNLPTNFHLERVSVMAINLKRESRKTETHLNFMGGPSYSIKSPIMRLHTIAASSFFGEPQYYKGQGSKRKSSLRGGSISRLGDADLKRLHEKLDGLNPYEWRGLTPAQTIEKAIDEALNFDAEATLQLAVRLRSEMHIRATPQVIMVRAAMHPKVKGTTLISTYGPRILDRMDEPATQMAYFRDKYGKKTPPSLRRAWAKRLECANEYELAKYNQEGRSVSLRDVIRVARPGSSAVDKYMKGQIKLGEELATWESLRSAGKPWSEAVKAMGHMALLRNLRNLEQDKALTPELLEGLVAGVERGRQLPFRYYTAYRELEKIGARGLVLDAVETAMETAFASVPHFSGRVMSLVDNSGSARSALTSENGSVTIAEIGNLMGVMTAKASDEGFLGIFGSNLVTQEVRKKESIFDALKKANTTGKQDPGQTEHGIWTFWRKAIDNKEHWDHVFVYSDMQAGHGGLYGTDKVTDKWALNSTHIDVPGLVKEYRKKVNPNVFVYLVQIAGYEDTIMPEFYDKTFILGGWSDEILRFAGQMQQAYSQRQ